MGLSPTCLFPWEGAVRLMHRNGINSTQANVSHIHHHGLNDSIVIQWRAMEDTFRYVCIRNPNTLFACFPLYTIALHATVAHLHYCATLLHTHKAQQEEPFSADMRACDQGVHAPGWIHPGHARELLRGRAEQGARRVRRDDVQSPAVAVDPPHAPAHDRRPPAPRPHGRTDQPLLPAPGTWPACQHLPSICMSPNGEPACQHFYPFAQRRISTLYMAGVVSLSCHWIVCTSGARIFLLDLALPTALRLTLER